MRHALIFGLTVAVFFIDLTTPLGYAVWMLYIFPLWLAHKSPDRRLPTLLVTVVTALIALGFFFSPQGISVKAAAFNRSIGVAVLWAATLLLWHKKQAEEALCNAHEELELRVRERTAELAEANAALRQSEESLKKTQCFLEQAQQIAQLGSWYWDIPTDTVTWSDQLYRLYGIKPGEFSATYEGFLSLVHQDDRDFVRTTVESAYRSGQPFEYEFRVLRPDGTIWWNHARGEVVRDKTGTPIAMIGVAQDITERKQAEEALRQSESRIRAVLNSALDAFIEIDAKGVITDWNPRAESLFGWTRKEAIGQPLAETIIPPIYREPHKRGLHRFLTTGEGPLLNKRVEMVARCRDGSEFPVDLTVTALKHENSYRFAAFIADITERKRAEDGLRASEAQKTLILQSVPLVIYVAAISDDFDVTWISENIERIVGFPAERFVTGKSFWASRIHPEDRERVVDEFKKLRQAGTIIREYRWLHANGAYHWLLDHATLTRNSLGWPKEMIGTWLDITERKRTEEELHEREEQLWQLLAERERLAQDLHDDIIQRIYAVGMSLETDQIPVKEGSPQAPGKLQQAIADLNGVIRDVRSHISGMEPSVVSTALLRSELAKLTQGTDSLFLPRFRLKLDPRASSQLTAEEAKHVLFIAREAMSNSLRHSKARSGVVSLRIDRGGLHLEVEDDGVGFDPNTQAGEGLGLGNIQARVRKLGAHLQIISERGRGTKVIVDIPKK